MQALALEAKVLPIKRTKKEKPRHSQSDGGHSYAFCFSRETVVLIHSKYTKKP